MSLIKTLQTVTEGKVRIAAVLSQRSAVSQASSCSNQAVMSYAVQQVCSSCCANQAETCGRPTLRTPNMQNMTLRHLPATCLPLVLL